MLVGDNGAGKTTFIKLLLRLYDVEQGEILINGINVKNIPYSEYIKLLEPVFQDVNLFAYTICENIALTSPDAADAMLMRKVLERSGVMTLVRNLPDGLNTYCTKEFDESGYNFSGGEKQKVMLARAMAQEPELLLLDEPTSCLDPKNRHDVLELVKAYIDEKRVSGLMVIHDVNLALRYCNRFLFMKHGGVLGCGGPEIVTSKMIQQVYEMPASVEMIKERKIVMFG